MTTNKEILAPLYERYSKEELIEALNQIENKEKQNTQDIIALIPKNLLDEIIDIFTVKTITVPIPDSHFYIEIRMGSQYSDYPVEDSFEVNIISIKVHATKEASEGERMIAVIMDNTTLSPWLAIKEMEAVIQPSLLYYHKAINFTCKKIAKLALEHNTTFPTIINALIEMCDQDYDLCDVRLPIPYSPDDCMVDLDL